MTREQMIDEAVRRVCGDIVRESRTWKFQLRWMHTQIVLGFYDSICHEFHCIEAEQHG